MENKPAHHLLCEWHLDQYPWECSCGATMPKAGWFDRAVQDFEERNKKRSVVITQAIPEEK